MKKTTLLSAIAFAGLICATPQLPAAGILTPANSADQPIQIKDHQVRVVINNGFAETEVHQTFYNPNEHDLEAVYSFPLPKSASLSEMTIWAGERELQGEVVAREKAKAIYEDERSRGNDAGLATKETYQRFEFRVTPVRAKAETRVRFLYYQPIEVDTGIGRYLYPMEEGGTDEAATGFWQPNSKVEGQLSISVDLKSASPVAEIRTPGFDAAAKQERIDAGHHKVEVALTDASLDRDFVFYYRLEEDLPGRIDLLTYKKDEATQGTFMMVVNPGIDLQPITNGSDTVFVLDVSGSMAGKIHTLANGISQTLGKLSGEDRFRIVTFESNARELTSGWQTTTPENVARWSETVKSLNTGGSTNIYDGLNLAFRDLDNDRATSIVLVTDGVTNTGVIDAPAFAKLSKQHDVRIFGFLLGNSSNWPLMQTICDASGGFYSSVSNADDIVGQLLLAKSKITHECLHDASLKIRGVKTFDASDELLGKVYRGQQLVVFGRYEKGGEATVTLDARLTGEDKTYSTRFQFPDVDTSHPELERLWALDQIERIEAQKNRGDLPGAEASKAVEDLGVAYQIVTDETSMTVLTDEAFEERGIDRRNRERSRTEQIAKSQRATQPAIQPSADQSSPMFQRSRPSVGGGGAIDPVAATFLLILIAGAAFNRLGKRKE